MSACAVGKQGFTKDLDLDIQELTGSVQIIRAEIHDAQHKQMIEGINCNIDSLNTLNPLVQNVEDLNTPALYANKIHHFELQLHKLRHIEG